MVTNKKRVQFCAPNRLIERADAPAAVLAGRLTDVLVTALRKYIKKGVHDVVDIEALEQLLASSAGDVEVRFTIEEIQLVPLREIAIPCYLTGQRVGIFFTSNKKSLCGPLTGMDEY